MTVLHWSFGSQGWVPDFSGAGFQRNNGWSMDAVNDVLNRLEENINRVVPDIKRLEEENARLKKVIGELQVELEGLKEDNSQRLQEIESFKRNRKEILNRVGRIRDRISSLEGPLSKSTG